MLIIFLSILSLLYLYNYFIFNDIPKRPNENTLRLGYINLHESPISKTDLAKLENYNCDIWIFLEWNGDNFKNLPAFHNGYTAILNQPHPKTFGTLVLAKDSSLTIENINSKSYTCPYNQYKLRTENYTFFIAHAPPPVPTCKYETEEYISDLTKNAKKKNSILIGDFNASKWSNGIKYTQQEGFISAKSSLPHGTLGIGTWLPKMIKVDYLFTKTNSVVKSINWFTISTSDHAGFVADLQGKNVDVKDSLNY